MRQVSSAVLDRETIWEDVRDGNFIGLFCSLPETAGVRPGAAGVADYTVPTGLWDVIDAATPTLKRGANNLCAYGAGPEPTAKTRETTGCDCAWNGKGVRNGKVSGEAERHVWNGKGVWGMGKVCAERKGVRNGKVSGEAERPPLGGRNP